MVAIVNYILGDIAENFKIHAANVDGEVDGDGNPNISVSDVVGVVNIILEKCKIMEILHWKSVFCLVFSSVQWITQIVKPHSYL